MIFIINIVSNASSLPDCDFDSSVNTVSNNVVDAGPKFGYEGSNKRVCCSNNKMQDLISSLDEVSSHDRATVLSKVPKGDVDTEA